jgi:hypothetical protein
MPPSMRATGAMAWLARRPQLSALLIMPYVQSSVMTFVKYDDEACELDITFTSGKTYRYREVPLEIYDGLLEAESKGEFFNDNIKDVFAYSEVRSRKR